MPHSARSRAAVGAVLLALAPVALRAQQPQPPTQPTVPADSASSSLASPLASPSGISAQMTQEIYVAAFRASARRWCLSAGAKGGDEPLQSAASSTRLIVHGAVSEAERDGVERAVDSTYAQLVRDGGCAALAKPATLVLVDRFEGHAWNSPKRAIAPDDRGEARESGVTVVTRGVKLGRRRFHKIGAEADFTFTTQREQLVRGRYRVSASKGNFAERWRELESLVGADYPTLRVARAQPAPPPADAEPTYAARAGYAAWRTTFNNPDTQALEVRMYAVPANGGSRRDDGWTIVVDYLGYAGR